MNSEEFQNKRAHSYRTNWAKNTRCNTTRRIQSLLEQHHKYNNVISIYLQHYTKYILVIYVCLHTYYVSLRYLWLKMLLIYICDITLMPFIHHRIIYNTEKATLCYNYIYIGMNSTLSPLYTSLHTFAIPHRKHHIRQTLAAAAAEVVHHHHTSD